MRPSPPTPNSARPTGLLRPLAAAAALAALTACGPAAGDTGAAGPEAAGTQAAGTGAATEAQEQIATVVGDGIEIRDEPDGEVVETLASPNDLGADRAFLVERDEGEWLEVLLPVRPNGSTGWIRRDEVELTTTSLRLEVDMGDFAFAVFDGEQELRSGRIGIGVEDTPTPPGRYYFTELLQPPAPDGPYGAYAFGLSGFSPTLETFAGGPGQLAVHGTDDEAALGTQVSHGCVRVSNADITWMAENLPIGTPVEITE
ncbi:L,D-transpeptidase [Allonocardiopsis opalescens]|uniref:L,D-transpeptidase-like protein n=1 Tax=Allonocardiopsis opalescens TaxID=1144618 RepID=A0A2T0QEP9_9ACTN|nr:L,D-transpeptidase [Allonocardiopsis opalescens]PRY02398.1 L,D-transpeptidase-like protein [Allonocardiopsis opalescens]